MLSLLLLWIIPPVSLGASPQEEIETLDIVEITGTVAPEQKRDIPFPLPQIPLSHSASFQPDLRPTGFLTRHLEAGQTRLLLDHTAQGRKMSTPVKPLNTDHPPYPRRAREQGWEGVVLLHLAITEQGDVVEATVKKSSGHDMLDNQALQTIQHLKFLVPSVVNLPIKFDLRQ
mgnify:CR=1 FL=1